MNTAGQHEQGCPTRERIGATAAYPEYTFVKVITDQRDAIIAELRARIEADDIAMQHLREHNAAHAAEQAKEIEGLKEGHALALSELDFANDRRDALAARATALEEGLLSAALALEEAAKVLAGTCKLTSLANIIDGHAERARALLAPPTGERP